MESKSTLAKTLSSHELHAEGRLSNFEINKSYCYFDYIKKIFFSWNSSAFKKIRHTFRTASKRIEFLFTRPLEWVGKHVWAQNKILFANGKREMTNDPLVFENEVEQFCAFYNQTILCSCGLFDLFCTCKNF